MKREMVTKMTAVILTAALITACGGGGNTTSQTTAGTTAQTTAAAAKTEAGETTAAAAAETTAAEEPGLFNLEGYPIVNEPITLTIGKQSNADQGEYQTLDIVQKIADYTGVNLQWVEYADGTAVSLMFADRDYPDIIIGGSDKQLADAAEAGDLYALDEYMDYAPIWRDYLDENPYIKSAITFPDGHIYSMPVVHDRASYVLRDVWYINGNWLNEVGLDVPTTIDEFYVALKAFKENAGKGTIPSNVEPYYARGVTSQIGGALDLITSYGIRVTAESSYCTVDDDGKVEFNWTNPEIKEPLKFMNKLINEGLMSKDGFTDDRNTGISKEDYEGSYTEYIGYSEGRVPFGPLDSGNGKKPMIRSQTSLIQRNKFAVSKKCEYPEIAMRLVNLLAEDDWVVYNFFGMYDEMDSCVEKRDDGTYYVKDKSNDRDHHYKTLENNIAELMSRELADKITYKEDYEDYEREEASKMYGDHIIPTTNLFPPFVYSDENRDRISELAGDIKSCVNQTINGWVLNGGIDEGWDAFIEQLDAYGLEEYLELLQEEYDRFKVNMQ